MRTNSEVFFSPEEEKQLLQLPDKKNMVESSINIDITDQNKNNLAQESKINIDLGFLKSKLSKPK